MGKGNKQGKALLKQKRDGGKSKREEKKSRMKAARMKQAPARMKQAPRAHATAEDVSGFVASRTFAGPKEGYVFTTRSAGTGYYVDRAGGTGGKKKANKAKKAPAKEPAVEAPPAREKKLAVEPPPKVEEEKEDEEDEADEADEEDEEEDEEDEAAEKEDEAAEEEEEREEAEDEKEEEEEEEEESGEAAWAKLGLHEVLIEACLNLKWSAPTAIQRAAIPVAMKGRDVIGLAETGSGKTGAFALPILQRLLDAPKRLYAVVLAPTRELAYQIHEVFEALGSGIGLRACCVVGGIDMVQQAVALAKLPHVVVATPGRLVDHLQNTKGFSLKATRCLVMDEADRMLSMDFEKELNTIIEALPDDDDDEKKEPRLGMLFSATMTSKVAKLQRASLRNPERIEVSEKFGTPKKLVQQYLFIPAKFKECYLAALLFQAKASATLVFAATCSGATKLALTLRNLGLQATCLHGQMAQPKRIAALNKFKAHKSAVERNLDSSTSGCVLVATDVAARGLDIPAVDLVLNYDLPSHGKEYVHRVGRTARAGRAGRAVAFVTQYDIEIYQRLEYLISTKLPACPLSEERALVHLDKVNEASRLAAIQIRDLQDKQLTGNKKGRKRRAAALDDDDDDDDDEEGARAQQRQADIFGARPKSDRRRPNKGGASKKKKRFKSSPF